MKVKWDSLVWNICTLIQRKKAKDFHGVWFKKNAYVRNLGENFKQNPMIIDDGFD